MVERGTDDYAANTDMGTSAEEEMREEICSLQRLYQEMLSRLGLREESVPLSRMGTTRGAGVMTSLGALSQAIDDYDLLHFRRPPAQKLADFADWLQNDAPRFYEDMGEGAASLAEADAVTVCTIHKAKGKEWPAVFIPGLAEGRFPHSQNARAHQVAPPPACCRV